MTIRSILALYAHPDDESSCAGTLAKHAAAGAKVTLVCATRGEMGEISDPALATPETLPQVRECELACAAKVLGIEPPRFFDYRDSGMDGTEANKHPDAFMNADADDVVGRLVAVIREVRPQVVITFDETGGYGHPDHIAIWRHSRAAVEAAAKADQYTDAGQPWRVDRIAYSVFPRSFFDRMREKLVELGHDTSELDQFSERGIGYPDEKIQAIVDVSSYIDQKLAAIGCHRTQFGGDNFFSRVGEDEMRRMMSREYFAFGWLAGSSVAPTNDLFP